LYVGFTVDGPKISSAREVGDSLNISRLSPAPESVGITVNSLCDLCELCVSVVDLPRKTATTETQRTLRMHREKQVIYFPDTLLRGL
jgi:hypothetical protein